mmetsp:Transcript_16287/g.50563  ORF Transcript_16287/g.50563 Transcript_16287/m.50563 type:complete len:206 (-) Transcript_16287:356-973(-)
MSFHERTASAFSRLTTVPWPSVAGPASSSRMWPPLPAAVEPSSPVATASAGPVHRAGRCSGCTGKASCVSSSSSVVSWNSHSDTGSRKRSAPPWPPACVPVAPGACCPAAAPVRPSCPATASRVYVPLPRKTYDLAHSAKPSSCTCTCVPKVMRPTRAFSGSSESACVRLARTAASSCSSWQTSSTKRKAGGGGLGCCTVYSIVV